MWSNAQVCGCSFAGVVGSTPAEYMVVRLVFVIRCVGSGLFRGLITRSGESYRVRARVCVRACVHVYSSSCVLQGGAETIRRFKFSAMPTSV
jgi:hypothetical protein